MKVLLPKNPGLNASISKNWKVISSTLLVLLVLGAFSLNTPVTTTPTDNTEPQTFGSVVKSGLGSLVAGISNITGANNNSSQQKVTPPKPATVSKVAEQKQAIVDSLKFKVGPDPVNPKIGVDSLKNPEDYLTVPVIVPASDNVTAIGTQSIDTTVIETPQRTEKFEQINYGFTLQAVSETQLNGITFGFVDGSGNESTRYLVTLADKADNVDRDGKAVTNNFMSEQYLFAAGVKTVKFFYSGTHDFKIIPTPFISGNLAVKSQNNAVQPQALAGGSSAVAAEYTRKFFAAGGINIVTRDVWSQGRVPVDSTFAPGWTPPYYKINRIVVHHTDTGWDQSNPGNTVYAIWQNHSFTRDWGDIGYNYLIDPNGNIYEGRAGGNGVRGNHAPPNEGEIGIALIGNYTNQTPTQASIISLEKLMGYLSKVNNIPLDYYANYNENAPKQGVYPHLAFNDYVKAHYPDPPVHAGDQTWRSLVTSCPGRGLLNILSQTTAGAKNYADSTYRAIDQVINYTNSLVDGQDIAVADGKSEIIIDTTDLGANLQQRLKNPGARLAKVYNTGNSLVYNVTLDMTKQVLTEISITAPESRPQPNYNYKIQDWTEDNSNKRSIPDAYNPSVSDDWYLEKIKAPEAWWWMNNNPPVSVTPSPAPSHGGYDNVIVAVIDTGVAYETDNADLGSSYSDQPLIWVSQPSDIRQIHIPGSVTPNGIDSDSISYEHSYTIAPNFIDANHDGIADNFVSPYDAGWEDFCNRRAAQGLDCNSLELARINHANDDDGHGTFVTSIIASQTGLDNSNIVLGISPNIKIMPIKVNYPNDPSLWPCNPDSQDAIDHEADCKGVIMTTLTVSNGIRHARLNGANVINLSLGGNFPHDATLESEIQAAYDAGIVVVAASGNHSGSMPTNVLSPANLPTVIAVGASNSSNTRASYSNYGPELDIVAPVGENASEGVIGNSIGCFLYVDAWGRKGCEPGHFDLTTQPIGGGYKGVGTSFAAPQVAAAAALIFSNNPGINPVLVSLKLLAGASDIAPSGFDNETGNGVLNIPDAINANPTQTLSTKYYFPLYSNYDTNYALTYIEMSNLNPVDSHITIKIHDTTYGANNQPFNGSNPYVLPANGRIYAQIPYTHDGPVTVESINGINFMVIMRSAWRVNSLDQVYGLTEDQITTRYYFPLYSNTDTNYALSYIEMSNLNLTDSHVTVKIANKTYGANNADYDGTNPYIVPANGRMYVQIPNIHDGPVTVESTNGVSFMVILRSAWRVNSLDQTYGLTDAQISTKYYFPLYSNYDTNYALTFIEMSNLNLTDSHVTVKIGTRTYGANNATYNGSNPYVIPATGRMYVQIPYTHDGPVIVESTNGVSFIVIMRSAWRVNSLDQTYGLLENQIKAKYYFPLYSNYDTNYALTYIETSNMNPVDSHITVKIGTRTYGANNATYNGTNPYTIPANGRMYIQIPYVHDGPVTIKSTDNVDFMVYFRSAWRIDSLDQMYGYPE